MSYELDAAQEAYNAAMNRANDAQRHIYDTDHLKWEAEQEWLKAQNSGDREESEKSLGGVPKSREKLAGSPGR